MPRVWIRVNPTVFYPSAILILLFVIAGARAPSRMERVFTAVQSFIVNEFGWLYVLSATVFLVFVVWLFLSPYGRIRLGKDDEEPEYSNLTWFAMLFSAGMGIGLLFFGVAEPVMHYLSPPRGASGATVAAARDALTITYFHWGLHAWAIYIIVGLCLAYFSYRHDLPLTIRSTLYPLLGQRIYGWMGDLVEILAVFGTLFGVATSLGLGVTQINTGLSYLGLLDVSITAQIVLIAIITLLALASVVSGLDVGIRRLSELNIGLSMMLLLFVLIAGPTVFLISTFVQSIGRYLNSLVELTFRTDAFIGTDWQASWTMFYWGWWISWSPFVGMFIARISRGRTIRSFVTGVLFVPTLLTFGWMTVFGGTALSFELGGDTRIGQAVSEALPTALFVMLEQLPLAEIASTLAIVVIALYFITSSDSASLVVDTLTAGGRTDAPVWQRVFWALSQGAIAAVLLAAGGLSGLQTAAITTALPFCLVMLVMCYSLVAALRTEREAAQIEVAEETARDRSAPHLAPPAAVAPDDASTGTSAIASGEPHGRGEAEAGDWPQRLQQIIGRAPTEAAPAPALAAARTRMAQVIEQEVLPAFRSIRQEMERLGREVRIEAHRFSASLTVERGGREEFRYAIRTRALRRAGRLFPDFDRDDPPRSLWADIVVRGGITRELPLETFTQRQVIDSFLGEYAKWMGW